MNKAFTFLLFFWLISNANSQPGWTWSILPSMPEPVSNNALVEGYCGDTLCVYSFCGIDTTLTPAGIHLKAWRYNSVSQEWTQLPDVPDAQGKIAASASFVNGKIYVIGGYYVNPNFTEESSAKTHVFNPLTNQWEDDAADIPVAIDDQVQAVWRDSLIYVVTGWSNTTNVDDVQIFNPWFNEWSEGTSIPNLSTWKSFGPNGVFSGDTLFYFGGVSSTSFSAQDKLRKGIVNPDDPTEIEWEFLEDFPWGDGYRMAAAEYEGRIFFIGGGGVSYNFDGLAYNGSGGVEPEPRIATYYSNYALWEEGTGSPYGVMDLRGIGKVDDTTWIIAGGMEENQQVSDNVYMLAYDPSVEVDYFYNDSDLQIWWEADQLTVRNPLNHNCILQISDVTGRLLYQEKFSSSIKRTPPMADFTLVKVVDLDQGATFSCKRIGVQ